MMNLANLEKKLEIEFTDKNILRQALTHRSYLNEHPQEGLTSNERLEFLGDAILEFLISQMLYTQFPKANEGTLTALRSKVVCTESLSEISQKLNLGDYLFLSKGEEEEEGRKNQTLLANVFEALVGAVFQDKGLQVTSQFIAQHLELKIATAISQNLKDYKSLLQEKTQEKERITPVYKILKEIGPDHAKIFTIGVFLLKRRLATGTGRSKQEAEQQAAKTALEKYFPNA